MTLTSCLFALYTFLACYCAGSMTTLQLQHYSIYPRVGVDSFKSYIQANNRAALLPAIVPSLGLTISAVTLAFFRPPFMPLLQIVASIGLNVVVLLSTAIWQGKLHAALGKGGYDKQKIALLQSTNWIRTIAFLVQGGIAMSVLLTALNPA
jgi:hypothetical protein